RGNIEYSAVIQPRCWPLSQGGTRSSRDAVQRTWVLPNLIRQEPSACRETARSMETRRSSSGWRFDGRMKKLGLFVLRTAGYFGGACQDTPGTADPRRTLEEGRGVFNMK